MNSKTGTLYIVATPIGNLGDMTSRAIEILSNVDLVIAEDTRHAGILLNHFAIRVTTWSCHEHNEKKQLPAIMARMDQGQSIALISDAGTPLINDPGYSVVNEALSRGINVVPVPGCCALITALCASGLPTDRFCFEGFIPNKPGPKKNFLAALGTEPRTIVLYESCHRIVESLEAICNEMGHSRKIVVARELTKKFEQFYRGGAREVCEQIMQSENNRKGEFVIVINGAGEPAVDEDEAVRMLELLMSELPLKSASRIAAKWLGQNRNDLYQLGLDIRARQN